MNEIEIVQKEVMPIPEQAKMIIVRDQGTLVKANEFFLVIRELKKKIASVFDPMEKAAKEAKKKAEESRKTIVDERTKIEAPLETAEAYLNTQIVNYKREQDRIRIQEEEINRQEAIKAEMKRRKIEEEERLAQATELEAAGAKEEAEALITETIEENQKPLEVYTPPTETQKVKLEGATVKEYWHAEVFNLKALCKGIGEGKYPETWVNANMTPLNEQARSRGNEMKIDGVRAVSVDKMAATGRR